MSQLLTINFLLKDGHACDERLDKFVESFTGAHQPTFDKLMRICNGVHFASIVARNEQILLFFNLR